VIKIKKNDIEDEDYFRGKENYTDRSDIKLKK